MKVIKKIDFISKVNLRFYDEALARSIFGKGVVKENYFLFKEKLSESEIFEGFNKLLKEMF